MVSQWHLICISHYEIELSFHMLRSHLNFSCEMPVFLVRVSIGIGLLYFLQFSDVLEILAFCQ